MAAEDRVHAVVTPIIDDLDLELVDLVFGGGRLKITIDHENGLDTELLTRATRMISHELDLQDPISGAYTLEVSSPGVERPLRTPAHFARSIGEQVAVKLRPNPDNLRRVRGELVAADDDTITVATDDGEQVVPLDLIAKASTVFDWGPAPKPGKKGSRNQGAKTKGSKNPAGKKKVSAGEGPQADDTPENKNAPISNPTTAAAGGSSPPKGENA